MGFLNLISVYYKFYLFFMSIGLFLRSFVVTRQISGFFISFALSMLVLPYATYFIFAYFSSKGLLPDLNGVISGVVNKYGNLLSVSVDCHSLDLNKLSVLSNAVSQDIIDGPISSLSTAMMVINLTMGFALLTILSVTVGLSKLFGTELYPWVLSSILRLR
jgi:hypothetical protein